MKRKDQRLRVQKVAAVAAIAVATLAICAAANAQQQAPTVSHPSTSSAQVTPRSPASPYGSASAAQVGMKVPPGMITGYVYWDMNGVQSKLSSPCQGLTATVSTVVKAGLQGQDLATTNNFTATGPMTDLSAQGTPTYMLCSYSFQKMPVGIYVKVTVSAQPSAFLAPVSVQSLPPFEVFGGTCNTTPQGTLSFILSGGELICGNNAFNVNFKLSSSRGMVPAGSQVLLKPAPHVMKSPGGTLLSPAPVQQNVTGPTASNSGQLLSPQPVQRGILSGGANLGGNSPASSLKNLPSPAITAPAAAVDSSVPKMPPMKSNARRDATPAADAATGAQIKSKLQAQLAALRNVTGRSPNTVLKPGGSNGPEIQVLQRQKSFVASLRSQTGSPRDRLVSARAPNMMVKAQPSVNPKLIAPQPTHVCFAPQIHTVNGASTGVIFTQDPAYNDYVISGCSFGDHAGQVYLSGAVTGGRINLVVKQWSDSQIEAVVEPGLTGVLDGWPDLMVAPAGGSPVKFPNCRFYSQRKSVLLPTIPQQYVTLANVTVGDSAHGFGTKYCPGPDVSHLFPCVSFNAGPPLDGITNGHDHRNDLNELVSNAVDRDGGQEQFNAGEDVYDLSSMAPGFEIDYSSMFWYAWTSDVCEGWASDAFPKKPGDSVGYDTEGKYGWYSKTKSKIVVDWGVDHCGWRWLGMFRVNDWYNSGYSLQVYVKGPIGVDPWTGHAVSVSQDFGAEQPQRIASAVTRAR